jgi:hypothetical protein
MYSKEQLANDFRKLGVKPAVRLVLLYGPVGAVRQSPAGQTSISRSTNVASFPPCCPAVEVKTPAAFPFNLP